MQSSAPPAAVAGTLAVVGTLVQSPQLVRQPSPQQVAPVISTVQPTTTAIPQTIFSMQDLSNDTSAEVGSMCFTIDPVRSSLGNRKIATWRYVVFGLIFVVGFLISVVGWPPIAKEMGDDAQGPHGLYHYECDDVVHCPRGCANVSISQDKSQDKCTSTPDGSSLCPRNVKCRLNEVGRIINYGTYASIFASAGVFFSVLWAMPFCQRDLQSFLRGPQRTRQCIGLFATFQSFGMILFTDAGFSDHAATFGLGYVGWCFLLSTMLSFLSAALFRPCSKTATHTAVWGFAAYLLALCLGALGFAGTCIAGGVTSFTFLIGAFASGFIFMFLIYKRCSIEKEAWNIVRADKTKYDKMWKSIGIPQLSSSTSAARLRRRSPPSKVPRQSASALGIINLMQGQNQNENPCLILTQLFQTARQVDPTFQSYVAQWEQQAMQAGHVKCKAKHAPVKKPIRAIQKLQRSYGLLDSLRLVDLVRATVVCPTLACVADLAEIVRSDGRMEVVREKNKFADGVSVPTGYRNMQFVLRMREQHQGFLCELQLDLKEFNDEKTRGGQSGHDNYKRWRNLKGE